MSRSMNYAAHWLEHDGKHVVVDGIAYTIKATSYMAVYPYAEERVSVYAAPVSKQSKYYRDIKRYLGDDWSTDVLDSENEWKFLQAAQSAT
jgi:hypothetical protein